MSRSPGHDSGQPFDWADYIDWLVSTSGSLAGVADRLAAQRGHTETLDTIERGLRRLRRRGNADGGAWGTRCLRQFGMPDDVMARARWMGHYHSRFTDLPVSVCLDLLRPWDRPPTSESLAGAWVQLGQASVALRRNDDPGAAAALARVSRWAEDPAMVAELALVQAFIHSRSQPDRVAGSLRTARTAIEAMPQSPDQACLWARLVDQQAYPLNVRDGDPAAARMLYASIPENGPPFATVRRHNGLGWCALRWGDRAAATAHARSSLAAAGDGGSLRLRAMALKLLARALGPEDGANALARAAAIAEHLQDETLRTRMAHGGTAPAA